jgi:hypothetical protein
MWQIPREKRKGRITETGILNPRPKLLGFHIPDLGTG